MSGDLKERIEEMLAGLGNSADAVADNLRARGLGGIREEGCHCPIANVIRAEFAAARESHGARWAPGGDLREGEWFVCGSFIDTPDGKVFPPDAVREFINLFDEGRGPFTWPYSDLERTGLCRDCGEPLDAESIAEGASRCDACGRSE